MSYCDVDNIPRAVKCLQDIVNAGGTCTSFAYVQEALQSIVHHTDPLLRSYCGGVSALT